MVWQCIAEDGDVCDPYISTSNMNAQCYFNECLSKRLLPFIVSKYNRHDVLLWMDLAACHYSNAVTDFLTREVFLLYTKRTIPLISRRPGRSTNFGLFLNLNTESD